MHLKPLVKLAKSRDNRFYLSEGILYTQRDQLVIPSSLRDQLISEYHEHTGHLGVRRTVERMKGKYWFQRMEFYIQ